MSEPTQEQIDTLRQKLRVAERIKQAAIDCTKSRDTIIDELVWEQPDIDAHEIPQEYVQTMVARYPHMAQEIIDFAKRWNSEKPISDAELADMEIDEESVKRSAASCLLMLKWSMRIRKAEEERDALREREANAKAEIRELREALKRAKVAMTLKQQVTLWETEADAQEYSRARRDVDEVLAREQT